MHILVLQHVHVEHPGIPRSFPVRDGHSWDTVGLDEGEPVPQLDDYGGLGSSNRFRVRLSPLDCLVSVGSPKQR